MHWLGGSLIVATMIIAAPAAAQNGWPQEPMTIGVGFNSCSDVLAAPDDNVRSAMVSQWTLGFYSGLAMAGAEADAAELTGLDAALNGLLRTSPDIRATINARVIAACNADPDAYMAQAAINVLAALIDEDTE